MHPLCAARLSPLQHGPAQKRSRGASRSKRGLSLSAGSCGCGAAVLRVFPPAAKFGASRLWLVCGGRIFAASQLEKRKVFMPCRLYANCNQGFLWHGDAVVPAAQEGHAGTQLRRWIDK